MENLDKLEKAYSNYFTRHNENIDREPNKFDEEVAKAFFVAVVRTLNPAKTDMTVFPSQTGTGKSTCMVAAAAALSDCGYKVTIACNTRNQTHSTYADLCELIDERRYNGTTESLHKTMNSTQLQRKVAIRTSAHIRGRDYDERDINFEPNFSDKFKTYELVHHDVLVCTHSFLEHELKANQNLGVHTTESSFEGVRRRDVIFLDEKPNFATSSTVDMEIFGKLLSKFNQHRFKNLYDTLSSVAEKTINQLKIQTKKNRGYLKVSGENILSENEYKIINSNPVDLNAFLEDNALMEEYVEIRDFTESCVNDLIFLTHGQGKNQINYYSLNIPQRPEYLLLDATAEIEEVQRIFNLSESSVIRPPQVNYSKLKLSWFNSPTRFHGSEQKSTPKYWKEFADYVFDKVISYSTNDDTILIVAKKKVVDAIYERYKQQNLNPYTPYERGGKKYYFIYWGSFIGENHWRDSKTVFLFTGYQKPRDIYMGFDGAYGTSINDEYLKTNTGAHASETVSKLSNADSLKWFKQLAARGNIRQIDEEGYAGEMTLLTDCDLIWLYKYQQLLFPGSSQMTDFQWESEDELHKNLKFAKLLTSTTAKYLTYDQILEHITHARSNLTKFFEGDQIKEMLDVLGWHHEAVLANRVRGYEGSPKMLLPRKEVVI